MIKYIWELNFLKSAALAVLEDFTADSCWDWNFLIKLYISSQGTSGETATPFHTEEIHACYLHGEFVEEFGEQSDRPNELWMFLFM